MEYQDTILEMMKGKAHPSLRYFHWEATKDQFEIFCQQEFKIVREFPNYLQKVLDRKPSEPVAKELKENILEEATGELSGFNAPHKDLYLHSMRMLGFDLDRFVNAPSLPSTIPFMAFLDEVSSNGSELECLLLFNVLIEGTSNDREELYRQMKAPKLSPKERNIQIRATLRSHHLVRHYGLRPKDLRLKVAHSLVEPDHRRSAYGISVPLINNIDRRKEAHAIMTQGLVMWRAYRNGIADACNLPAQYRRAIHLN